MKSDETLRTLTFKNAATIAGAPAHAGFVLHVVIGSAVTTHALPSKGEIVIGRSRACDVCIDDPSVSRQHMRLRLDDAIVAIDLGAQNGIVINGVRLAREGRQMIQPGATMEIGGAMVVLQRGTPAARPRRIWSHTYFEGRVEDECARAERTNGAFSILRVRSSSIDKLESLLSSLLEPSDVLASYGPADLEALLMDRVIENAREIEKEIRARAPGLDITVAVVSYPKDGRSAGALLAAAHAALEPQKGAPSSMNLRPSLVPLVSALKRIARGNVSVLVTGETGVGKELIAELVHQASPRASKTLVKLNCAALSETLLASELFGHERGAFTGADRAKQGILELADGGTVFLDEIGELPTSVQPKLLRVLEDRTVIRVGALRGRVVDVRFVSATNRDLDAEVAQGRFREDLYYRLNGFQVHLPPLRQEPGDIDMLVSDFLASAARAAGLRKTPPLDDEARALIASYSWPGNARELRNVIERAVLLSNGDTIGVEHLPVDKMRMRVVGTTVAGDGEKMRITAALAECGGNQTHAARLLGISRGTLLSRMDAYGLIRPRKR